MHLKRSDIYSRTKKNNRLAFFRVRPLQKNETGVRIGRRAAQVGRRGRVFGLRGLHRSPASGQETEDRVVPDARLVQERQDGRKVHGGQEQGRACRLHEVGGQTQV